jgi:hypothetical protein
VRREAGDLVAQALGLDDRDLLGDALVRVKVGREARIVLLDDQARGLLDRLGADATCAGGGRRVV